MGPEFVLILTLFIGEGAEQQKIDKPSKEVCLADGRAWLAEQRAKWGNTGVRASAVCAEKTPPNLYGERPPGRIPLGKYYHSLDKSS